MDDRAVGRFCRWLGTSTNRRTGIGGIAAGLLGFGLNEAGSGAQPASQARKASRTVKFSGAETFNASPQEVWNFVTDADSGASCSAAVQRVTSQSGNRFEVKVKFQRGAFNPSGTVEGIWSNMVAQKSGKLSGTGKASAGGWLEHNLEFTMKPVQGGAATTTEFMADVVFYGMLARVSQKRLNKYVESTGNKFIQCVRDRNGW